MSFTKYASFESSEILEVKGSKRQRTANLEKLAEFEDYRTEDGYLYARIRAISSRVNKNSDGWPSVELAGSRDIFDQHTAAEGSGFTVEASKGAKYGFSTFLGKPIFVDHNNSNPARARGVIVDAKLHVEDHKTASSLDPYYASAPDEHMPPTWVELLLEVDAKSFPKLAKAILEGSKNSKSGIDGFSMGCNVEKSVCSICKNAATAPDEYCNHVKLKGAHFDYIDKDGHKTSKRSYEDCYGIQFFEISAVFDPADETALIREVKASVSKEAIELTPPPVTEALGRIPCKECGGEISDNPDPKRHNFPESFPPFACRNCGKTYMNSEIQVPDTLPEHWAASVTRNKHCPHCGSHSVGLMKGLGYWGCYSCGHQLAGASANDGGVADADDGGMGATARTASVHTADNPLPQADMVTAPDQVDTLREEDVCPVCGSTMDQGHQCEVCFTPDTLVRTKNGLVPISTIEPGDLVLTESGKYEKVARLIERDFNGLLYEMRSRTMTTPVRVTGNHPIQTLIGHHFSMTEPCSPARCDRTDKDKKCGARTPHELDWRPVNLLSNKSYVVAHSPTETFDLSRVDVPEAFRGRLSKTGKRVRKGPMSFALSPEFLWAIGLYLAEGCSGDRTITYSLHANETDYQERLKAFWEGQGFTTRLQLRDSKPNSAWVHVHSSTLAEWFPAWLGEGCANKRIPSELWNLPLEKAAHVRQGILDGDGCNKRNQLGQTSEILILQMTELSLRSGFAPTIQIDRPIDKRIVYKINGTGATAVANRVNRSARGTWKWKDKYLVNLPDLRQIPYWGKVYNLSVENDPTYVVQNMLVHNCGYVAPPEGLDNPDLGKAQEENPALQGLQDGTAENVQEPATPGGQVIDNAGASDPSNSSLTASVTNDMSWQISHPKLAGKINPQERPLQPGKPPSNEPVETIVSDPSKPTTSRTAASMIAAVNKENTMSNERTADAASGAPEAATPDKRVDVTGIGGVIEDSNVDASKADVQVDVVGKGGVEDASNEAASKPDERENFEPHAGPDDAGFNKDKTTDGSGPSKTWNGTGGSKVQRQADPVGGKAFPTSSTKEAYDSGPWPAQDENIGSPSGAKKGTEPVDPVGKADERIDLLKPVTSPENNSGKTKTWNGTDGNGVTKQQPPVTRNVADTPGATVSSVVEIFKLADLEVDLGLIEKNEKYERIAELENATPEVVQAELAYASKVKTAGLRKSASTKPGGVGRVPSFHQASVEPTTPKENTADEGLFW